MHAGVSLVFPSIFCPEANRGHLDRSKTGTDTVLSSDCTPGSRTGYTHTGRYVKQCAFFTRVMACPLFMSINYWRRNAQCPIEEICVYVLNQTGFVRIGTVISVILRFICLCAVCA